MTNYSAKLPPNFSILVTGGEGQIAKAIQAQNEKHQFNIYYATKNELDITDDEAINQLLNQQQFNFVINTAAYTKVDQAESDLENAFAINHIGAKKLAKACQTLNIPLLHLSTDYVFNGQKHHPYLENDKVNPINEYGKSKLFGEKAIREYCEKHYILRVSGVFSEFKTNFLKTILHLAKERKTLNIISDQLICPTYARHIADTIFKIISANPNWGTYHYCSHNPTSWYEFTKMIIDKADKNQLMVNSIKPISSKDYRAEALRPAYSVLDCQKIKNTFGINQPSWEEGIQLCLKHLE